MEKIIYPGMKPAEPAKPFKLEGVPDRKYTIADVEKACAQYKEELYEAVNTRISLLMAFGNLRDAKIKSPTLEQDMAEIHRRIQFLDAAMKRVNDLYTAGRVLISLDSAHLKGDAATSVLDKLPEMKKLIPVAIRVVAEQIDKRLDETSQSDMLAVSVFADYSRFQTIVER